MNVLTDTFYSIAVILWRNAIVFSWFMDHCAIEDLYKCLSPKRIKTNVNQYHLHSCISLLEYTVLSQT